MFYPACPLSVPLVGSARPRREPVANQERFVMEYLLQDRVHGGGPACSRKEES